MVQVINLSEDNYAFQLLGKTRYRSLCCRNEPARLYPPPPSNNRFAFKKIALASIAGLAAFSVSCSDSDGTDPGGKFTKPLAVTLDNYSYILLNGEITATQPDNAASGANTVNSISVTVNGKKDLLKILPAPVVPAPSVDLTGSLISGACQTLGATNANVKVKVEVTATFKDGADLVESGDATIDCSDADLVKTAITLSAGASYADLDIGASYNQANAAAKKADIDLVAYNGEVGKSEDAIYNPKELTFFYGGESYIGGNVILFSIPAEKVDSLKNATKFSQLSSFLTEETLAPILAEGNRIDSAPTTKDTGFLVLSTEGKLFAVIVTETGTQSVDLSSIALPISSISNSGRYMMCVPILAIFSKDIFCREVFP